MSKLKKENIKKCVSLLREFVEESSALDNKKERAILALNQLQKITAGTDPVYDIGVVKKTEVSTMQKNKETSLCFSILGAFCPKEVQVSIKIKLALTIPFERFLEIIKRLSRKTINFLMVLLNRWELLLHF